jgi:thioredoxin reductase (NADPH)
VADSFDVVVAGGGIAGLTAALTSARLGSSTMVLTGGVPGGLLLSIDRIDGVPGYPDGVAGYDLCPLTQEQAAASGAAFSMGELEGLEAAADGWQLATSEGDLVARALIVATGARFKRLDVPGEDRLRGHGVSDCASCDAPLLRDRVAAVVGGGDSALQEALTLAESVAQVIVLQREDTLTAQEAYRRAAAEHPRIEIRYRSVVEEVLGDERVAGVRVRDLASDALDDVAVDAVFPFVGLQPSSQVLDGHLELDGDGSVPTDAGLRARLAGVFAAGIVRRGSAGRAAASAGEGAAAAVAAHRYLEDGLWAQEGTTSGAIAVAHGNGGADG